MILETLVVPLPLESEKFSKAVDKATNKTTELGKSMMKIGGVMTASLTVPLTALGVTSIDSASSLNESMNKVQVVFGDTSQSIIDFSENSAKALGMSQQQALEATGTFGNLFSSMGLGQKSTVDMSTGLVQLAADLASFNNIDPSEALEKLRSGIVGETEPLRSLGVNLSAAAVTAKAMEMGLADSNGKLNEAALVTARYQLILDQTKNSQGDFARTSDGLANSTRIVKAEFENVKAQLGQALLPIITQLMQALIPLLNWFNNLNPSVKNTIVIVLGLVAALGPLITGIGGVITTISSLSGVATTVFPVIAGLIGAVSLPVIALIAAIGALIAVILIFGKDAWNTVTMVAKIIEIELGRAYNWLSSKFLSIWNGITNAIQNVINWVKNLASELANLIIPSWLRPGSPTPFEIGLRGIGSAMKDLSLQALPEFGAQFALPNASIPVGNNLSNNSEVVDLLRSISNKKELDERELAKLLRDAVVQVSG